MEKSSISYGTNTQYIKGDGTFATYSAGGLPLTGGTLTGNLKIDQGSASSNPRLTFAHDNIGTNHYIQMDRGADAMNIFVNGSNAIVIDSNQNATFYGDVTLGSNNLLVFDTGEKVFYEVGIVVADGDYTGFIARDSGVNKLIINGSTATFE